MRARTGAAVLVGTAVVLLLLGLPGQFMGGVAGGGAEGNTNVAPPGDIGGAAEGTGASAAEGGEGGAEGGAPTAGGQTPAAPATAGALGTPGSNGGDAGRTAGGAASSEGADAAPDVGAGAGAGVAPAAPRPSGGESGGAPAVRTVERERILVLGSVFFPSGRADLGPDARRLLEGVAATYKGTTQRLEITGHTDTRGSAEVNATLSRARAEAVRGYLAARGIPATQLVVRYAGASRPMATGASSEDNAQNRRVELSVAAGP